MRYGTGVVTAFAQALRSILVSPGGGVAALAMPGALLAQPAAGKVWRNEVFDIPVAESARFSLVINMKTAKAMGLVIPPAVLLQATELIE